MKGTVIGEELLVMDSEDTVGTAIEDLEAGFTFEYDGRTITLEEAVPFGHKVALVEHADGDDVRKYGIVIGAATERIGPGAWVHTHNCASNRGRGDLEAETA
ncbi:MAG: UxaA family hydrolase [Haloarculaceae archaeon]